MVVLLATRFFFLGAGHYAEPCTSFMSLCLSNLYPPAFVNLQTFLCAEQKAVNRFLKTFIIHLSSEWHSQTLQFSLRNTKLHPSSGYETDSLRGLLVAWKGMRATFYFCDNPFAVLGYTASFSPPGCCAAAGPMGCMSCCCFLFILILYLFLMILVRPIISKPTPDRYSPIFHSW